MQWKSISRTGWHTWQRWQSEHQSGEEGPAIGWHVTQEEQYSGLIKAPWQYLAGNRAMLIKHNSRSSCAEWGASEGVISVPSLRCPRRITCARYRRALIAGRRWLRASSRRTAASASPSGRRGECRPVGREQWLLVGSTVITKHRFPPLTGPGPPRPRQHATWASPQHLLLGRPAKAPAVREAAGGARRGVTPPGGQRRAASACETRRVHSAHSTGEEGGIFESREDCDWSEWARGCMCARVEALVPLR